MGPMGPISGSGAYEVLAMGLTVTRLATIRQGETIGHTR
jgi:hypothetical protein